MKLEKFININWYMERKPYTIHSDYDIFYLKICRGLYSIIDELAIEYEDAVDIDEEDCRELAYVFTAYFEDQANRLGFWQSLVQLHEKHFGKRVPFYDNKILKEQEDEFEDILPADIHYLVYISYLNVIGEEDEKALVYFNKDFFLELTERVFDYLSDIEEVLTTDFYQNYLIPDDDFIDFKLKLDWFTFKGYLTKIEFSKKLDNLLWKLIDEETDKTLISPVMYGERDRLMFEVPSALTAFFPIDILAGAMHCDENKKAEIRNLKYRPHGIFHVQHETASDYLFLHTATNEEFKIVKKSFNKPFDSSKEEYWITSVAKWNNEYYISGLCLPSPYHGEEIYNRNIEMQHSFQKHFPEYRRHIEQTALEYRNEAAKFFGKDLIVFETGHQLQKKLTEFDQWYFDHVSDKSKLSTDTKPVTFILPKELLAASKIALFIPPADGLQFVTKHEQLLQLLQTKNTGNIKIEEIEEVLPMLLDDSVGADYWFYLRKNFAIPNLSLFMKCPAETDEDFEAMLRIYRSEDFSRLKFPRFSTFTSERISHETARQIFSRKEE